MYDDDLRDVLVFLQTKIDPEPLKIKTILGEFYATISRDSTSIYHPKTVRSASTSSSAPSRAPSPFFSRMRGRQGGNESPTSGPSRQATTSPVFTRGRGTDNRYDATVLGLPRHASPSPHLPSRRGTDNSDAMASGLPRHASPSPQLPSRRGTEDPIGLTSPMPPSTIGRLTEANIALVSPVPLYPNRGAEYTAPASGSSRQASRSPVLTRRRGTEDPESEDVKNQRVIAEARTILEDALDAKFVRRLLPNAGLKIKFDLGSDLDTEDRCALLIKLYITYYANKHGKEINENYDYKSFEGILRKFPIENVKGWVIRIKAKLEKHYGPPNVAT